MKTFPYSDDVLGIKPVEYRAWYAAADNTVALPLIDANGLVSHEGVMYSSFYVKALANIRAES